MEHSTVPPRTLPRTVIHGTRSNHESEIPVKARLSRSSCWSLLSTFVLLVGGAIAQTAPAVPAATVPAPTVLALDQIQNQADLDRTITTLDAALFDAYNRCDLVKFASFIADDVEFYHDQGGVTLGQTALTESVKKNICGRVTRELVPGTLQVYYMKGYGALEVGVHRFHHPGHEDTEGVGEGKFIHLWQYKNGAWKITRVMSYDHHAAAK
jgi:ketosteroid isomerase-like protein